MAPTRRRWIPAIALALLLSASILPAATGAKAIEAARPGGALVLTFHNGWATAGAAAQIIEAAGGRATFYVPSDQMRVGPWYTDFVSAADLQALARRGHEVGSMGTHAIDPTRLSDAELRASLATSKARLEDASGHRVESYAYPYGAIDPRVQAAVAAHYASGRGVTTQLGSFLPTLDAYGIPAIAITRDTGLEQARAYVDHARATGVHVVLAFERIKERPGPGDWTPQQLRDLVAYAAITGVPMRTVSEMVSGASVASVPGPRGTVVFTFDDGSTTHIGASKLLSDHGFRGTFYIVSKCEKSEANREYCMSPQQVKALHQAGHDIQSHTVRHRDLVRLGDKALKAELQDSREALEKLTGKPVRHIAYPYGSHDESMRRAVAREYATGRIFLGDPEPKDLPVLLSYSNNDPMLLPGIGITATTTVAEARAYVDYAIAYNATVVLVLHDIVRRPIDEYSWHPNQLEALVDHVAATGVTVKTLDQAFPSAGGPSPQARSHGGHDDDDDDDDD